MMKFAHIQQVEAENRKLREALEYLSNAVELGDPIVIKDAMNGARSALREGSSNA